MTGWRSSRGARSIENTSIEEAVRGCAVVQIMCMGLRLMLSTCTVAPATARVEGTAIGDTCGMPAPPPGLKGPEVPPVKLPVESVLTVKGPEGVCSELT